MYERLHDNNVKPTFEEAIDFLGEGKALFKTIDAYLVNELNAEKKIAFSNHDKCWCMGYQFDQKSVCEIYFEKGAVFVVIGFSLAKNNINAFENMYNSLSDYGKTCVDKSPWRRVGFVEYRVLSEEHLNDLTIMLNCRANQKYRKKSSK